jgi:hypothetical protein
MLRYFLPAVLFLFLAACSSPLKEGDANLGASYLGDASYEVNSLVVSVKDVNEITLNLHLSFNALVTPRESFIYSGTWSELRGLIRRLETRIKSQLLLKTLSLSPKVISRPKELHSTLTKEAQTVFDAEFKKWKKASYFDVKIVLSSFYFTNLSVGEIVRQRCW